MKIEAETLSQFRKICSTYSCEIKILGQMWSRHIRRAVVLRTVPGLLIRNFIRFCNSAGILRSLSCFIRNLVLILIPDWKFIDSLHVYGDLWAMDKLILWCDIYGEEAGVIKALKDIRDVCSNVDSRILTMIINDVVDFNQSLCMVEKFCFRDTVQNNL